MKSLTKILILLTSSLTIAHSDGPGVTNAKVAELAAHRIDRLATLGKIDVSFSKQLQKIEVAVVNNQAPLYYKARVSQSQPPQGTPLQVDISFDDDGKPLAFQLVSGGTAGPDSGWTEKDGGSLAENALHYILENNTNAKVALFDKGLTSLILTKGSLNGVTVVQGQALSSLTSEKLNIYLKLDGTFISAEMIP